MQLHYRSGELAGRPGTGIGAGAGGGAGAGTGAGSGTGAALDLDLSAERAGWRFASLRVVTLPPGGQVELQADGEELVVLSLEGAAELRFGDEVVALAGRADVFSGPSDVCYVPPGRKFAIASESGGRFAVAGARAERGRPLAYRAAESVSVELRGAGSCSRRIHNYAMGETLPAERLLCCEVVTPAGNWSSFPPHKHDEALADEAELEEIYYFEVARDPTGRRGVAYQRLYGTPERPIDLLAEVGHGDVVLIPHGYHGPSMAMPGYDLYYLNVMAGPAGRRWLARDDPDYHWVRETWQHQQVDPRLVPSVERQGAESGSTSRSPTACQGAGRQGAEGQGAGEQGAEDERTEEVPR